jgi:hypothetical protein
MSDCNIGAMLLLLLLCAVERAKYARASHP